MGMINIHVPVVQLEGEYQIVDKKNKKLSSTSIEDKMNGKVEEETVIREAS